MNTGKYIAVVVLLYSGFGYSQDFKTLVRQMRNDYEQCKTLHLVMELTVYDSAESAPYYKQTIDIKRSGNNYWYQFEENELLLNDKYLVMVDNNARQISLSNRNPKTEAELYKSLQFNLDSIFSRYETFQYLGKEDGAEHYLVIEKNGPIEEVHFFIQAEIHELKKMAYRYRQGHFVIISFNRFDKNVPFKADTFSESRYVTKVNEKIVPSSFYKQYRIQYQ
jgi:hypothetical protein